MQRAVMIYTETSPNPNSMKFVLNFEIVPDGLNFDYPNRLSTMEEGKDSPLASGLFQFPYVQRVFLSANYITLTKDDATDWGDVIFDTKQFIKIHFDENQPVFTSQTMEKNTLIVETNDSEVVSKIKTVLDQYVRPAVETDGGAISFASFDEITGLVQVHLQGSCSGCPSSTQTLKLGIENLLTRMVPEVKTVEAFGV